MDQKIYTPRGSFNMSVDSTPTAVIKAAPAVGGVLVSFSQLPWSEFAAFLTCIYVAFQIGDWIWKKYKAFKEWKALQ